MELLARLATELQAAAELNEVDRLTALVGIRERLDAEIAVETAAFDERAGFDEKGYRSPASFLVDQCRISRTSARKYYTTGRALKNFPAIAEAARTGKISFDHARIFARKIVPPRADEDRIKLAARSEHKFLAKAKTHTADDFGKICTAWRQIADEDSLEAQQRIIEKTDVTIEESDEDDTAKLTISGPRTEVRMIYKAITRITDELWRKETPKADNDTVVPIRHRKERRFRAAVLMAKRAMARSSDDWVLPEALLNVQMDFETFERELAAYAAGEPGPGPDQIFEYGYRSKSLDGVPITPGKAFAIGMKARLRRLVIGAKSRKVDLGRSERCYTGAAREAVMQRDTHCQHPGCDMPGAWCDVDHILEWQDGGHTNPENGQLLCRWHHTRKSKNTLKQKQNQNSPNQKKAA